MQWFFSLFTTVVLAAESIISPLPDGVESLAPTPTPMVTFGQLASFVPPPEVLGVTTVEETPTTTPQPSPTPPPRKARKNAFTIAVLGDSMVDTLGPDVPHLKGALSQSYPGVTFTMLNHGVGATNIDYGLERLMNSYTYLGVDKPPLILQNPDLVVVESFGYNPYPFDEGALDKHWLQLGTIVSTLREHLPGVRIVIAATIAPDSATFGDGAPGVAFGPQDKIERTANIKRYLDNAVRFAQSQNLPLADAFHASLDGNGDGKDMFINGGDHIHYSDAGRQLFASAVTNAIIANKLLE